MDERIRGFLNECPLPIRQYLAEGVERGAAYLEAGTRTRRERLILIDAEDEVVFECVSGGVRCVERRQRVTRDEPTGERHSHAAASPPPTPTAAPPARRTRQKRSVAPQSKAPRAKAKPAKGRRRK